MFSRGVKKYKAPIDQHDQSDQFDEIVDEGYNRLPFQEDTIIPSIPISSVRAFIKTAKNDDFSQFISVLRNANIKREIEFFSSTVSSENKKYHSEFSNQLLCESIAWANQPVLSEPLDLPHFESVRLLCDLMIQSECSSFSAFILDLKITNPSLFLIYQQLDDEFFPNLGFDKNAIFMALKNHGLSILSSIPVQYREYIEAIERVKGTPITNLFSTILAYAIGFSPYILGNIVTSKLNHATHFGRLMLSASPTGIGGFLRFWVANQVDSGHGKKAVMSLLAVGITGLFGLLCLINTIDLNKVETGDGMYWALFVCNILSGAGIANYSASVPIAAQVAPNDSPSIWRNRLHKMGNIQPNFLENGLSTILRKGPKDYIAIVAGIGSLTPSITLISAAFALPTLGLKGIYALFGAITLAGTLGTGFLLHDSILDQLRNQHVPDEIAKEIATWMGQKLQSHPEMTLINRLKCLNSRQIKALVVACINYITTFGLLLAITATGTLTLSRRGMSPEIAMYYTASISGLSSLTRALMAIPSFPIHSSTISNMAFITMIATSLVFALSTDQSIWLPMLLLFSIANGVGNYGVFAQISDTLSEVIGLASGLSGASGAISAFFICIAFASLSSFNQVKGVSQEGIEQTDTAKEYLLATAFCSFSLVLNVIHEHLRNKIQEKISEVTMQHVGYDLETPRC